VIYYGCSTESKNGNITDHVIDMQNNFDRNKGRVDKNKGRVDINKGRSGKTSSITLRHFNNSERSLILKFQQLSNTIIR